MSAAAIALLLDGTDAPNRKTRAEEFQARHGDKWYTQDFNTALGSLIGDAHIPTVRHRVLSWVKRQAWGNHFDYAVDDKTLKPLGQVDCAQALNVDKRQVNNAIRHWEAGGYVRTEGRKIIPVDDPEAEKVRRQTEKIGGASDFSSAQFRRFQENYQAEHAEAYRKFQEAQTQVKSFRRELLNAYKEFKKSHAPRTKAEESHFLQDPEVTCSEDHESLASTTNGTGNLICLKEEKEVKESSSSSTFPEPVPTTTTTSPSQKEEPLSEPKPTDQEIVAEALSQYIDEPAPSGIHQIIRKSRQADPRATAPEIARMIHKKAPGCHHRETFVGYCIRAVPDEFAHGGLDTLRAAPPPAVPSVLSAEQEYENLKAEYERMRRESEGQWTQQLQAMEKQLDQLYLRLYAEKQQERKAGNGRSR